MSLGSFVRERLMKFKVFLTKGQEYYNIVYGIITLSIFVGVWMPYFQTFLADHGIIVSKGMLTITGLIFSVVSVVGGLVIVGWFTFQKDITQAELFWRDVQHPMTFAGMHWWAHCIKILDLFAQGIVSSLSKKDKIKFLYRYSKIKEEYPVRITIGDKVIVDFDKVTIQDLNRLIKNARSIK